jgi:hypothetical protein
MTGLCRADALLNARSGANELKAGRLEQCRARQIGSEACDLAGVSRRTPAWRQCVGAEGELADPTVVGTCSASARVRP